MRNTLSLPALSDRASYEHWLQSGAHSSVDTARKKVREILATHQPLPLPEGVRQDMAEVVATYSS
jgi:trimethylamine--corrinoid protein Co-methyltransferase